MRQYSIIFLLICFTSSILCDDESKAKHKCIVCNESPKCAQNPKSLDAKECPAGANGCIMFIDKKGKTNRNCALGKDDFKNALNPTLTKACNNSAEDPTCNDKIFPENRPKCAISDENGLVSSPCKIYNEKTECFTVKINNKVTKGCVNEDDDVCNKNPNACRKCTGNDCNKDNQAKCFQCSGTDCKRTGSECKTLGTDKIVECKNSEGCYTLQQGNELSRGCLSDLVGQPEGLNKCNSTDACNGDCVTDINKCLKCDSKSNSECSKDAADEKLSAQCKPYNTACYYCEDQDGILYRGCGDPKNGTYSCNYCHKENCKPEKPQRSCLKCDSSNDGLKCVLGEDFTISARCSESKDDCVVLIKDGNTIRGCAKDILGEKGECAKGTCSKCNKHNCNYGIFPTNRRRCFQCALGSVCRDEPKGDVSKPCLKYDPNEKCYMYSFDHEMYRGCKSDTNSSSCASAPGKGPCIECDKSDCNRSPYEKPSSIKCIKCKKDDIDCIWGQGSEKAVACENKQIKYFEVEKCYTSISTNDNKTEIQRGCEIDSDACKEPGPGCEICEGDMCNQKNFMKFTCIRCRSDNPNEEKCANIGDAIGIAPSACTNENIQKSEKGCYTRNYRGATVRGCFADLDLNTRGICKDVKNHHCDYCEDVNCNNKKVPNSSTINSLFYVFFIISIATVFLQ